MTLVLIPTNDTLDGMSPPGELNTRQRIDERCLPNLQACADAFFARFGIKLIVTEGSRSRPRQDFLWAAYQRYLRGGPFAVVAARPYLSKHDEVTNANAVDFGSNVAKPRSEQALWMHENCHRFGITWTGAAFGESWHHEISRVTVASSTPRPIPTPTDKRDEVDMASMEEIRTLFREELGKVRDTPRPVVLVRRVADGTPVLNGMTCALAPDFFQHLGAGDIEGVARDLNIEINAGESGNGLPAIEFTRLISLFHIPPGEVRPGGSYSRG